MNTNDSLIKKAQEEGLKFIEEYKELDLQDNEAIEEAYTTAVERWLFELAEETRKAVFGNKIKPYGVCYISDACISGCRYCPIRAKSIDSSTWERIKRKL